MKVAGSTGLEPATPRSTIWCSNRIELRPRSLRTGMTLPDSGRGCKHYLRVCRKKPGHFILTGFRQDSTGKHCAFVKVPSDHVRCFSLCRGGGHGTPWGSCRRLFHATGGGCAATRARFPRLTGGNEEADKPTSRRVEMAPSSIRRFALSEGKTNDAKGEMAGVEKTEACGRMGGRLFPPAMPGRRNAGKERWRAGGEKGD